MQDELERFLPNWTLRNVTSLELLVCVTELPATWAGLTCLEQLALQIPPWTPKLLSNVKEMAPTLKELTFMISPGFIERAMIKDLAQSFQKHMNMPCISSVEF